MNSRFVYFDNNATTPLDPDVRERFIQALDLYGNPSSMHMFGRQAHEGVEWARGEVARLLGALPEEILFTGGGSESNNTVLKSVLHPDFPRRKGKVITTAVEHPCILETAAFLKRFGVPVVILPVDSEGKIDMNRYVDELDDSVALVSVMLANNEIGTIQDIADIAKLAKQHGAYVHTDAVQGVGKIPVDVEELQVDYLTASAHKLYAPKGVGALYRRKGAPLFPLIHGGHQEKGLRAGTINGPSIIAFGCAAEKAGSLLDKEYARLLRLRTKMRDGILASVPDVMINGHSEDVLPGTLDVSFFAAEGESILLYLDIEGIAVSTGSACATGSLEPSHVLMATGMDAELAHGSIRFSLGRFNTEEDVDYLLEKLPPIIERIRKMSTVSRKEVHQ
ncbi:cysteine desulfurase family protein [Sediminispirochaeta smaragdinae]|uniref:cysteine desulfurase n=1 Tax=Sediminispirochaeta smaragdinae (strain DSM 11293 / JCM 15392 / SEBR 4228) TaxID=573413 RepID=E1R5E0_SEDSS|nr:aminotransferase class V-fold PLP-dependent enzyme [Sediminispirochaeta smaragdinae]ADK82268.1 Cysteine desulfurase [Sediminispirochaeta smaragdinae DSM 11293]